jgi:hypothetical protein
VEPELPVLDEPALDDPDPEEPDDPEPPESLDVPPDEELSEVLLEEEAVSPPLFSEPLFPDSGDDFLA